MGRPILRLLEHLHPGLIHLNQGTGQELIPHQVDQRLNQLTALDHPVGKGGPGKIGAQALEHDFLPVQGQRIHIFGRGHIGQQARGGNALGNRLWRQRSGPYLPFAAGAGILAADMPDHFHPRRNDVKLLRDVLAHGFQAGAIVRADFFLFAEVMDDLAAWQVLR